DLPTERVRVLLLDRIPLRGIPEVDEERERRAADPDEALHGLLVLGIRRRLGRTPGVEFPVGPEAGDAPPVRMARLGVRLRAAEVPVVAADVRELADGPQGLDRRGFAADDPEHAAHVSPACTRSS